MAVEGLGCVGMTGFPGGSVYGPADGGESIATIHRARELGVTLLDTADVYGPLRNERLMGKAVAGRRADYTIATKCGRHHNQRPQRPPARRTTSFPLVPYLPC